MSGNEPGPKIRIGVSACLLGQEVRYDGEHSRHDYIADTLARAFELAPVCPEVEFGMPIPRPPIQLEGDPADPRLVVIQTREQISDKMKRFARRRIRELEAEGPPLCGYIFKSKSPSCGVGTTKVFDAHGDYERVGTGLFARELMDRHPDLPVLEDVQLDDPAARDKFRQRVLSHHRRRG